MRNMLGIALLVAVFVPGMIITAAQNQPLKFEVASLKPTGGIETNGQREFFGCRGTGGSSIDKFGIPLPRIPPGPYRSGGILRSLIRAGSVSELMPLGIKTRLPRGVLPHAPLGLSLAGIHTPTYTNQYPYPTFLSLVCGGLLSTSESHTKLP
jgi:hypothetical protein